MTDEKTNLTNDETWIEVQPNENVRILFRMQKKMDPVGFMKMLNMAKPFVKMNTPNESFMSEEIVDGEKRVSRRALSTEKEQAIALFQKGYNANEVAQKLNRPYPTVYVWGRKFRANGMI